MQYPVQGVPGRAWEPDGNGRSHGSRTGAWANKATLAALDKAVDRCYRAEPLTPERERVEYLFALYEKLTMPLAPATSAKKTPH